MSPSSICTTNIQAWNGSQWPKQLNFGADKTNKLWPWRLRPLGFSPGVRAAQHVDGEDYYRHASLREVFSLILLLHNEPERGVQAASALINAGNINFLQNKLSLPSIDPRQRRRDERGDEQAPHKINQRPFRGSRHQSHGCFSLPFFPLPFLPFQRRDPDRVAAVANGPCWLFITPPRLPIANDEHDSQSNGISLETRARPLPPSVDRIARNGNQSGGDLSCPLLPPAALCCPLLPPAASDLLLLLHGGVVVHADTVRNHTHCRAAFLLDIMWWHPSSGGICTPKFNSCWGVIDPQYFLLGLPAYQ